MSKVEVLNAVKNIGTSGITSAIPNPILIQKAKDVTISELKSEEVLSVSAKGLLLNVFIDKNVVLDVTEFVGKLETEQIKVGDDIETLKEKLVLAFDFHEDLRISSQRKGFGDNFSDYWVRLDREVLKNEEVSWLFDQNLWTFRPIGTYSNFWLHFSEERLSKIEFKNYFVELP